MRNRIQSLIRKLKAIGAIAFNILQLIGTLITIISASIGAVFLSWLFHLQSWIVPSIAFMLGVTVTLFLIIFFVSKSSPPRWLLRGYRHVKWESLYEIDNNDSEHHTFRIKVLIEAIQPGVHVFEDTYQWTGRGKEGVPEVKSPGHTLMGNVIQRSGWKYYYVNLGRDLHIGERTEVELFHDLYDSENEFQPFLAKIISQPLDHLQLRVVVPKKNLPSNIHFTEHNTVGPASVVINRKTGTINYQSGEILWDIPNPVFGHRYEISWN